MVTHRAVIRDFKQSRFWETHLNRKWRLFRLKFVLFSVYTCRDDVTEHLGKATAQESKTPLLKFQSNSPRSLFES